MARAVVATAFGGPEVLSVVDVPVPVPGPGQVRVYVNAAGTNPVDYKAYSGTFGADPSQLPMRLGREASGVVIGVGDVPSATGVHVGDEVICYPAEGAYSTELVVDTSSILPKPAAVSFEEASGLMVTGVAAVHALSVADVVARDTLVVHGAAGGVGEMAVQLAITTGARVIGTASSPNHEDLRSLGAEPVAYGPGLLERIRAMAPQGVDACIDTVGTDEAIDTSIALVTDRSRIVTIAGFQRGFELGLKVLGAAPGADPGTEIRSAARHQLVDEVEAGGLKVRIAATFAFRETAVAHVALASGHTHGKIALVPDPEEA
jgi:NADPH:quinone reductase-like Zn-dependent oxidoreductase